MSERELFLDAFAGAIVTGHRQKRWKPNLPRIAALGELLGFTAVELEPPNGAAFIKVMERIAALAATLPSQSRKSRRNAERTAERSFGPAGDLAPNFMTPTF